MFKKAFTLIELLVSISLIFLLSTFTYSAYRNTQNHQADLAAINKLISTLHQASSLAQSGYKTCSGALDYYQVTLTNQNSSLQITTQDICSNNNPGTPQFTTISTLTLSNPTSLTLHFLPLDNRMEIFDNNDNPLENLDLNLNSSTTNKIHILHLQTPNDIIYQSNTMPKQSHLVCQNNTCVTVQGSGVDECATNIDCNNQLFHYTCFNTACIKVSGPGNNTCHTNADCTY